MGVSRPGRVGRMLPTYTRPFSYFYSQMSRIPLLSLRFEFFVLKPPLFFSKLFPSVSSQRVEGGWNGHVGKEPTLLGELSTYTPLMHIPPHSPRLTQLTFTLRGKKGRLFRMRLNVPKLKRLNESNISSPSASRYLPTTTSTCSILPPSVPPSPKIGRRRGANQNVDVVYALA